MNILYALSGHGFGHATRSKVVVDWLKKQGHFVKIVTYGQSLALMKNNFPGEVVEIKGFHQFYFQDRLVATGMLAQIILKWPMAAAKNFPLLKQIVQKFQIELVMSDFEPFSRWLAQRMKIPLITIDNQSAIKIFHFKIPTNFFLEYWSARILLNFITLGDYHILTSFTPSLFPVKEKFSSRVLVVPPILRRQIFSLQSQKNNFILVYQTASLYKKQLANLLTKFPKEKFVCYNLEVNRVPFNVILKNFDENAFFEDLSNCKAVILNGGFTAMSEAIYLKKPVLSLPIKGDFEQIFNALTLEKDGYGLWSQKFKKEVLEKFLQQLPIFEKNLSFYQQDGNIVFEKKLERILKKIQSSRQGST